MIFLKWNRLNRNCSGCLYHREIMNIAYERPLKTVYATSLTFWVEVSKATTIFIENTGRIFSFCFFFLPFFSFTSTYALPDLKQPFWSPQSGFGVTHYPFCGSYHLFYKTYHPICSTHFSFCSPSTIGLISSEILPHPPRSLLPYLRNYFIKCTLRPSEVLSTLSDATCQILFQFNE